jgi:hypothetical protein
MFYNFDTRRELLKLTIVSGATTTVLSELRFRLELNSNLLVAAKLLHKLTFFTGVTYSII